MRLARLERRVGGWRIHFDERAGRDTVDARFLIDASGRRVVSQRATGAEPIRSDRLVAAWLRGRTCDTRGAHAGWSEIESAPDGWWYTAPVVSEGRRARRVLAFHSDADLIGDVARDPGASRYSRLLRPYPAAPRAWRRAQKGWVDHRASDA